MAVFEGGGAKHPLMSLSKGELFIHRTGECGSCSNSSLLKPFLKRFFFKHKEKESKRGK